MFPTNRGICFSLKDNSNGLKTFDSCTVRAQSFSLQGIIRRAERSAVAAVESPEDFANIFNSGSHIVFCFWGVYFLRYVRLCFSTARSAGWPQPKCFTTSLGRMFSVDRTASFISRDTDPSARPSPARRAPRCGPDGIAPASRRRRVRAASFPLKRH
jgi:hypothetical protein